MAKVNTARKTYFLKGIVDNGRVLITSTSETRGFILIGNSEDLSCVDVGLRGNPGVLWGSDAAETGEATGCWIASPVVWIGYPYCEAGGSGDDEAVAASRGKLGTAIKTELSSNGRALEYHDE